MLKAVINAGSCGQRNCSARKETQTLLFKATRESAPEPATSTQTSLLPRACQNQRQPWRRGSSFLAVSRGRARKCSRGGRKKERSDWQGEQSQTPTLTAALQSPGPLRYQRAQMQSHSRAAGPVAHGRHQAFGDQREIYQLTRAHLPEPKRLGNSTDNIPV